jgi:uncharacterized membrane protein YbhN (UPF0104 family)
MPLSPVAAHLLCILLLTADLIGRALRIQGFARAVGRRITFSQAFQLNAWGDGAAGLTPMRFGGEMAKLAGLLRAGVAPQPAVVALGLEAAVTYPLVALFGGWLAWRFAPTWWDHARPAVEKAVASGWSWVMLVGLATLVAGLVTWRWRARAPGPAIESAIPARLRDLPALPVLAAIPLSLFNVVARTLMLPLLAQTLPEHPPFGVMAVGSFVLLYSQLFLPTPAGAGAVDLGFLSGMAGDLGAGHTGLLVAWRFYTVGAGALLGLGLALNQFGVRPMLVAIRRWVTGRSRPA